MKHLFIILAFATFATSCSKEDISETALIVKAETDTTAEIELIDLINEYRNVNGFESLQYDENVYFYASQHANYMINEGRLSHDNFNKRAQDVTNTTGAIKVGENVAKSLNLNPRDVVNGWVNSGGHLKNIVGDFTHTAIAVKIAEDGTKYYTQIFIKK